MTQLPNEPNQHRDENAEYICDSCGESIVIPLDISQGSEQQFIEDCPVCCHPNQIIVSFDDSGQANLWCRSVD